MASGDQLQVKTSFVGAPETAFTTVVQTAQENFTVGSLVTGPRGAGVFEGNLTLQPGTYEVGLLVFVAGQQVSPVGISVPRAIEVTLPTTGQASTTTSSSSTASQPPQAVDALTFAPIGVPNAPPSYAYGAGGGGYALVGGGVRFSLSFSGQNPSTEFALVLSFNGSEKTIGQYTSSAEGNGNITAGAQLGQGTFVLSLSVVDQSTFPVPTPVLSSIPSSFTVSTGQGSPTPVPPPASRGLVWSFSLVPATNASAPEGYRFPTTGTAVVSLNPRSSQLDAVVGFQDANPSTTYDAALVLNGTRVDLGTMTTNRLGQAVLHSSIQESPGGYLLGVSVYDVSDAAAFKTAAPVLVLVSDPGTQLAVLVPPSAVFSSPASDTASNGSQSATSSSVATSTPTTAVTTISAGSKVQAQIQDAVENLTIPATVQVTPLSTTTNVLDSRFSLSVGQQVGNGLVIGISGENVTGPRVLLINMSKTSPLALYPALNVTLDGSPVAEASSAVQVLNPVSTNPPLYVLVATSDSIQLLVSIPHFSVHIIQVAGVIVHSIESSLELDAPVLAGSVVVVTLAILATYAARKRYLSVLL